MSVWINAKEELPPLDEKVLILYKDKTDSLTYDKLFYGLAKRMIYKPFPSSQGWEDWSQYTEYKGYYEVVYWARLYDMPRLEGENDDDI